LWFDQAVQLCEKRRWKHQVAQRAGALDEVCTAEQVGVDRRLAEQFGDDAFVELEELGQQRRMALAVFERQHQQVVAQRRIWGEDRAGGQPGCRARAQQRQGQVDAGALAGDVVLGVGEQTLVAQVDLRRQADEQHIALQVGQAETALELQQRCGRVGGGGAGAQRGGAGDRGAGIGELRVGVEQVARCEQRVDIGLGDIQAAKFVVVGGAALQPDAPDMQGQQRVEPDERGSQVC
jgi:hypothetical protein